MIEKPTHPPPQVPSRSHVLKNSSETIQQQVDSFLPPIGFVVDIPELSNQLSGQNNPQSEFLKNKENINAQISIASGTTDSGSNLYAKPPKPTLPRRMGNSIATYLSKFEKKDEEETNDDKQGDRSSSEVTSL